jgi:hypothetical protein
MRMSLIPIMLPPLNEYLTGALGKNPVQRHRTAREFAREMQAAVERV